jgi:hypothetical protein
MANECYSGKWSLLRPQCLNLPVWRGKGTGNLTDEWTWCAEHAPDVEHRVAVREDDDAV